MHGRFVNRPYRFGGFLDLMPVGEDIILPCMTILPSFSCENATSLYTREALVWFSPYYLVLPLLLVGATSGRPPYIKVSLRITRAVRGLAAARSRSRSDNTPCCHSLRSRRYATPAPTGLYGVCCFWCRGDSQCFRRKLAACQAIARGRPMVAHTGLVVSLM